MNIGFAQIHPTSGEIMGIMYSHGQAGPTEGLNSENTVRHVTITDSNIPNDQCKDFAYFMANYVYNSSTSAFVQVASAKPNDHATYNISTSTWSWPADKVMSEIRVLRNQLLNGCDWTQAADSPLSSSKKTEWATYRTSLRNLPANVTGNPATADDITWPTEPS